MNTIKKRGIHGGQDGASKFFSNVGNNLDMSIHSGQDGGSKFFWNVGNGHQNYKASEPENNNLNGYNCYH